MAQAHSREPLTPPWHPAMANPLPPRVEARSGDAPATRDPATHSTVDTQGTHVVEGLGAPHNRSPASALRTCDLATP